MTRIFKKYKFYPDENYEGDWHGHECCLIGIRSCWLLLEVHDGNIKGAGTVKS